MNSPQYSKKHIFRDCVSFHIIRSMCPTNVLTLDAHRSVLKSSMPAPLNATDYRIFRFTGQFDRHRSKTMLLCHPHF